MKKAIVVASFGCSIKDSRERYIQQSINNTVKRVHQSMEAFIHNVNTIHSRGGNQVVS